jgi:hypothetical protein
MLYAFGYCIEQHTYECYNCNSLFQFIENIKRNTNLSIHSEIEELKDHLLCYLSHQMRKAYLNTQFNANLLKLDKEGAILVVDYKMKILPKSARETKQEFFGKKGWTLHTVLVYTRPSDSGQLQVTAYDHWSADMRQDAWFTASSLHAVVESLENKPKWIIILSDNGPHYHNAELMMIMGYWYEWYQIFVKKWIFLEAGEAKTTIDSHHAQVVYFLSIIITKLVFNLFL